MKKLFAAVLVLSSLYSVSAFAGGLNVCNQAGETIWVAYASYENDKWISHGWYQVASGGCTTLTTQFTNTRYYLYANSASGKEWGANHPFCVEPHLAFTIVGADDHASCAQQRNFFSVWVPDVLTGMFPDHRNYTFSPILSGASNKELNDPRAE